MRGLPKVKVRKVKRPAQAILPAPHKPSFAGDPEEVLTGQVRDMKASAAEERRARALDKLPSVDGYEFRYTIGAPRGLPGWKEIDFLVSTRGMIYAEEVDSAFTHRTKKNADKLHDAIILKELRGKGMNVYPVVNHIDGEKDLIDQKTADAHAKRLYG